MDEHTVRVEETYCYMNIVGVGDTIDCGLYDTTEVLEGVDFQYVYHLAIKRDQDRVFVDRMGAWQYSAP